VTVLWCKECGRWLQPPKNWTRAQLESKELLTFCIKRVRNLNKTKLIDAGFIWTEPHSKRLKLKLTIQKEVFNGAILQQTFVVEFVVEVRLGAFLIGTLVEILSKVCLMKVWERNCLVIWGSMCGT
jgi:NMD protein affecting ribosome stability and mRNA decay